MASDLKIGFLGAGKMASALAKGFVQGKVVSDAQIVASDPSAAARAQFAAAVGSHTTSEHKEVLEFARVLVLAVKPDQVDEVLKDLHAQLSPQHLLISIAAGVPLARLEGALHPGSRVIRVMPNTPALVGASATAFALGKAASADDALCAKTLLSAIGIAYQVDEKLLD